MRISPICSIAVVLLAAAAGVQAQSGKAVYDKACVACHAAGIAGAPRYGNALDWQARLARGPAALYKVALEGNMRGMPPRGGRSDLSDVEVKAAVDYMLAAVKPAATKAASPVERAPKPAPARTETARAAASAAAPAAAAPAAPIAVAPVPPPVVPAVSAPAAAAASATSTTGDAAADVNAFNRLLRPPAANNPPPSRDGIHDPQHDGTQALQAPMASFSLLPSGAGGNRVNWVAALAQNKIAPRWDKADSKAQGTVMDLNIVREVKGTMPNVIFPHKQHTEWLDCSNCHPAIFIPQKGANQISMAAILLGQKCGVCHGKVAFPVSECRLCHAQKKDAAATAVR
jgi:c(7)-type cytochrome triheme protein